MLGQSRDGEKDDDELVGRIESESLLYPSVKVEPIKYSELVTKTSSKRYLAVKREADNSFAINENDLEKEPDYFELLS